MAEHPENSLEQLKSEFSVRYAEINDPYHVVMVLHKARPVDICLHRFIQKGCVLFPSFK